MPAPVKAIACLLFTSALAALLAPVKHSPLLIYPKCVLADLNVIHPT